MPVLRSILLLIGAVILPAAATADAQAPCRPPNLFTLARKTLSANIAVTKALEVDVRLRPTAAGMRRTLVGLEDGAKTFGEICNRPGEFVALVHAAAAHRLLGRADTSLALYRRALRIAGQLAPLDTLAGAETFRQYVGGPAVAVATVNHYIGDVYRDLGRPDSALAYYRRGEGFVRHRFDINLDEPDFSAGDDSAAAGSDGASSANRRTAPHATLASIGDVYRDLGAPDSALAYYRRAMALARDDRSATRITFVGYGTMNMHEARYQIGLGSAFLDAGLPDSALIAFRAAGALARNWPLGRWAQRRARTDVLDGVARALLAIGRPDTALVVHGEALGEARKLGDRWAQMRAMHAIARLHHRHLPMRALARAVAYYDSAATALAGLSGFAGADANRVAVAERGVALMADWTMAWLARAGEIGPRQSALAALGAAEQGRAQALLRLMQADDSGGSIRRPMSVAEDAERLVAALASTRNPALTYLATTDTLVVWLTLPDGGIHVALQSISRDSLAALVETVRAGFGIDDATGGRLGGNTTEVSGEPTSGERRPARTGLAAAGDAALVLSGILLPAAWRDSLGTNTDVVIVPHGPLTLLPFGALPLARTAIAASDTGATWNASLAVRYAPSLTAVVEVEARRPQAARPVDHRTALIAGNPAMPSIRGSDGLTELLPQLPAAEVESRWVAERLNVSAITGGAASEREIRRRMPDASLVHLATHGFAYSSDARARESFVALASDSLHDGLLTVAELLDDPRLQLTADLVVLSACRTGLGDLKSAEGMIGLPRAFLARGARSVLVSLWNVSDEATRLLMERFYTHWLGDPDAPSKAQALQRAAADVRTTEGFEHPRFWAAFQLVGAR